MKKNLLVLLTMVLFAGQIMAQTANGVYRETSLIDKNGNLIVSPFDQYKICNDTSNYMFSIVRNHGAVNFHIGNFVNEPITYTGKDKKSDNDHSLKYYDFTKKGFTLAWYSEYVNHFYFPTNDWCEEFYESGKYSPEAKKILNLLQSDMSDKKNPFIGTWHRVGVFDRKDAIITSYADMYKVYGKNEMAIFWGNSGKAMTGNLWNVKYDKDTTVLQENEGNVIIKWINNDKFRLSYFPEGDKLSTTELWERANSPFASTKSYSSSDRCIGDAEVECPTEIEVGKFYNYVVKIPENDAILLLPSNIDKYPATSSTVSKHEDGRTIVEKKYIFSIRSTKPGTYLRPSFRIYRPDCTSYYNVPAQTIVVKEAEEEEPQWAEESSNIVSLLDSVIFLNRRKMVNLYDSIGNKTGAVDYEWRDNQWILSSKHEGTLDSIGNITSGMNYEWRNNKWNLLSKFKRTYDSYGNETSCDFYDWRNNKWILSSKSKYEFTYNSDGKITSDASYSWHNNKWILSSKSECTYDSNGKVASDISYDWSDGKCIKKSELIYDSYGNRTSEAYYDWRDNKWTLSTLNEIEYTYDSNGNMTSVTHYDCSNGKRKTTFKNDYTYNSRGKVTSEITYHWIDEKWSPFTKNKKTYDPYGNEISNICSMCGIMDQEWREISRTISYYHNITKKNE